ncbi:F-box protein [Legionella feeleii]|uniref:SidC homolog n=1 Tax=Legionella feeleii TaxID=453 RepID=A0A378IV51_9GAMM|nr:F-box protein [Legionella feeleii]STX38800.1 SidC homolog [Legionella feeleii]
MQSKCEDFNELPKELKIETAQRLSNRDLINLSLTSRYHLALFKPAVDSRKLLHYVSRGDHDVVRLMLMNDISLIFKRGVVKDCSGREFEPISPFEYALWALDKHLWDSMIGCIPGDEEGRKVFAQLIAHYERVCTDGVTYKLDGKIITEQHFDFENTIIKELQIQVDSINASGTRDWAAINRHWREGVGGAQKLLPMHVVHEYCSDRPFYPVPEFATRPKTSSQFYNWLTHQYENWFTANSKLGSEFAIYKGGASRATLCSGCCLAAGGALGAVQMLFKIRIKEFASLRFPLEERAVTVNPKQVPQA